MTVASSRRATTGCTKPNWRMAALERVELLVADAPRVGRVGTQLVDGDLLDGEGNGGCLVQ